MTKVIIATLLAICFYSGSARAQSSQAVELVMEYGKFVGKTATEAAIQQFVVWYFSTPKKDKTEDKPRDNTDSKTAEQLYEQMLHDPKFRATHPEVTDLEATKKRRDQCFVSDGSLGDTVAARSEILDSKSVSKDDLAAAYHIRGEKGDFTRAVSDLTKAIEINPDDASVYFERGQVYRDLHLNQKAIRDFRAVIKVYEASGVNEERGEDDREGGTDTMVDDAENALKELGASPD
jgi:tetratricopeptide (TPR) repeat protein